MAETRVDQSLQMAVIVLALLTIVTSAATFYQFKAHEDSELRAAAAGRETAASREALAAALQENLELRRLAGFGESDSPETMRETHRGAMSRYAGSLPEHERNLVSALAHNFTAMQVARQELAEERARLTALAVQMERLEADKDATLARHRQEAAVAMTALTERTVAFANLQKKLFIEKTALSNLVTTLNETAASIRQELTKAAARCRQRTLQLENERDEVVARLRKLLDTELEAPPDGHVNFVSLSSGTVGIDLGRADGLRNLVGFGVWDRGAAAPASPAKGRIEVVRVLGDHQAVARIVNDERFNPIVPGDHVSTPLWASGDRLRFAICGDIDLDGDGQSDLPALRNSIAAAGGVIDSQLHADGRIEGTLTIETRYVIVGKPYLGREQQFYSMLKLAKESGVEPIAQTELLAKLGRKPGRDVPITSRSVVASAARTPADAFRRRVPASGRVTSAY